MIGSFSSYIRNVHMYTCALHTVACVHEISLDLTEHINIIYTYIYIYIHVDILYVLLLLLMLLIVG